MTSENPGENDAPGEKDAHGMQNGGADRAATLAEVIRAALNQRVDSQFTPSQAQAASENYRNSMNHYRRRGQQSLAEEDYRQAAEKSWGAFAQSVKAIAADYESRISFHGSIVSVAGRLATIAAQEDPDAEAVLRDGLQAARASTSISTKTTLNLRMSAFPLGG